MSTHNIPFFNMKTKPPKIIPNLQLWDFFFQRIQERVQKIRGKRAISVQASEVLVLLYSVLSFSTARSYFKAEFDL